MFTALARGGLRLLAAAGGDNFYLRSLGQTVNPVGDHAISGGKPGADDYFLAVPDAGRHAVFADLILIVQHPYEMPFVAHLQRGGRDHHRVLLGVHQQAGVNELIGEQRVVQIAKARLQLDGPGGRIDLVIEAQQLADADFLLIGAIPASTLSVLPAFCACTTVAMLLSGRVKTTSIGCVWVRTTIPVVSRWRSGCRYRPALSRRGRQLAR